MDFDPLGRSIRVSSIIFSLVVVGYSSSIYTALSVLRYIQKYLFWYVILYFPVVSMIFLFPPVAVQLYSPDRPLVDTAEAFLWLMAVGTILCASYWSAWSAREASIEHDKLLKVSCVYLVHVVFKRLTILFSLC